MKRSARESDEIKIATATPRTEIDANRSVVDAPISKNARKLLQINGDVTRRPTFVRWKIRAAAPDRKWNSSKQRRNKQVECPESSGASEEG